MAPTQRKPRLTVAGVLMVLIAGLVSRGDSCFPSSVTKTQTGFEQCDAAGHALYCGSSSIQQTLQDGAIGGCCYAVDSNGNIYNNQQTSVGYFCAYGASSTRNRGCYTTLELARFSCNDAPSIVRCTP